MNDLAVGDLVQLNCEIPVIVQKDYREYISLAQLECTSHLPKREEKTLNLKDVAIILEILDENKQRLLKLCGRFQANLVKIYWNNYQGWISKDYLKPYET